MRLVLAFALVLAPAPACALFPDVGLLAGDGGVDASAADGPGVDDAADAAVRDAADAGASPCATPHTFCDDFDDGSLGAKWTVSTSLGGGALLLGTNAVSPPSALEARVPAGGHPVAELTKTFTTSAQHVHFECDLMVVGAQGTGLELDVVNFALVPPPPGFDNGGINVERDDVGSVVEEDTRASGADAGVFQDDPIADDFHVWRHLTVDVDFPNGTATTKIDGAVVDTMTLATPLASEPIELDVGATYAGGLTTQWSVFVDNVVVDLK